MDRTTPSVGTIPLWILSCAVGLSLFSFEPRFVLTQPLAWVMFFVVALAYGLKWGVQALGLSLKPWVSASIPMLLLLGVIAWLFVPGLFAQWGQVDDHEIMTFLGSDQRLTVAEFVPTLLSTEVGHFGTYPRFRPVYFSLRLVETMAWGLSVEWWYGCRFVLLCVSFLLYWQFLRQFVGRMWSSLLLIFVLTSSSWADIFARLGPSETYAVFGLALLAVTAQKMWPLLFAGRGVPAWLLLCWGISGVVCVGSKENMLIVMPLFVVFAAVGLWRRSTTILFWLMQVCVFALASVVASAVIVATHTLGSDVYGAAVDGASRAAIAVLGLKHIFSKQVLFAGAGVFFVLMQQLWQCRFRRGPLTLALLQTLFWLGVLEMVFLSQFVFYTANFPSYSRYDFPGLFVFVGFWIVLGKLAQKIALATHVQPAIMHGFQTACMVGVIATITMRGFIGTQVRIQNNVVATHTFFAAQKELHRVLAEKPDWPVRIHVTNINQYEAVFSQAAYIRVFGVQTPITVDLDVPPPPHSGLDQVLFMHLQEAMTVGRPPFVPRSKVTAPCWQVEMTTLTATACTQTSREKK